MLTVPPSQPLAPMQRRVNAAQATLDKFKGVPFQWGKHDCARMVAFHLRQLGYRPSLAKAGTYRSALGAKRALARAGYGSLSEALDQFGFIRVPPASTVAGDLVAGPPETTGLDALGVQLGNGRSLGWHPDAEGAVVVQLERWEAAWRVEPL